MTTEALDFYAYWNGAQVADLWTTLGNQTSAGVFANANSLVAIGDADQSTINISSTNSVTTGKEGALRQSCG